MKKFFKTNGKLKVSEVQLFNGYINDDCTDYSEWHFDLPYKLAIEMKDKYNLPKYYKVVNGDEEEILFLSVDSIHFEYSLSSNNNIYDDNFESGYYIGDDYRTAKNHHGIEEIRLCWSYMFPCDDGSIDYWEGYVGDEYFDIFNYNYEYLGELPNLSIDIDGEDKELLLNIMHPIMEKIIDGDQSIKEKLYTFNGD